MDYENLLLFLKDQHYKVLQSQYSEGFFGNFIISILLRPKVELNVVRDRGRIECRVIDKRNWFLRKQQPVSKKTALENIDSIDTLIAFLSVLNNQP